MYKQTLEELYVILWDSLVYDFVVIISYEG